MKKFIKANISENRYIRFSVIDELPKIGDIIDKGQFEVLYVNEVRIDCEQPSSEVFEYDYFVVVKKDLFDEEAGEETIVFDYVCVKYNDELLD